MSSLDDELNYRACDHAYQRAAAHWKDCAICRPAGGDAAPSGRLCPIGERLRQTWEAREAFYAHRFMGGMVRGA